MNKTLYWLPRIFGILFILFVSLFALDVFEGTFSWVDLFMYLLPSLLLLIALIVAWRLERVGGILWMLLAVAYVVLVRGDANWVAYLVLPLPALIIGILFLIPKNYGATSARIEPAPTGQQPKKPSGDAALRNQTPDQTAGDEHGGPAPLG